MLSGDRSSAHIPLAPLIGSFVSPTLAPSIPDDVKGLRAWSLGHTYPSTTFIQSAIPSFLRWESHSAQGWKPQQRFVKRILCNFPKPRCATTAEATGIWHEAKIRAVSRTALLDENTNNRGSTIDEWVAGAKAGVTRAGVVERIRLAQVFWGSTLACNVRIWRTDVGVNLRPQDSTASISFENQPIRNRQVSGLEGNKRKHCFVIVNCRGVGQRLKDAGLRPSARTRKNGGVQA
ncbi:hypothetical protein R3P38DRAFT_2773257 [Favolaschia claudopus]|uniref:Uncharacterized protein n=1 Tax=Favolaschia claudopus TaxID=2862362 RepID=A0AAW0C1X0_9AGAR